jgi:hypothetical protein
MFRGWSTKRIANALHCSADTVRDLKGTVEFQTRYAQYERQQLERMDRALVAMLTEGITTLRRQLRHRDPWVRDAAIEKILKIHGKYVEKLDITARLDHARQPGWWEGPQDDMSDEQRVLARELLKAARLRESIESPSRLLRNAQGQPPEER